MKDVKGQTKLYRSIVKYGIENHTLEIIEECPRNKLNEREIYWGLFYDAISDENLNCKLGEANCIYSAETRKKISDAHKGKKKKPMSQKQKDYYRSLYLGTTISEETKKKISEAGKGRIASQETRDKLSKANIGKKHTEETKKKLSEINKGKKIPDHVKKAVREANMKRIYPPISGEQKIKMTIGRVKKLSKPVIQYDINMVFIKEWSSIKEAAIAVGKSPNNLSSCLSQKTETAGGFKWKYKSDVESRIS